MTLSDLINQRDAQRDLQRQHDEELIEQAGEFLYQAVYRGRSNFERAHDSYHMAHGNPPHDFQWLGMSMWPNVLEDKIRTSGVITITQAQMDALLLSTFQGHMKGGVRRYGLMYYWKFQPREDGWIELLVEAM